MPLDEDIWWWHKRHSLPLAPTFSLECQGGFLRQRRARVLNTLPAFKLWDSLTTQWIPLEGSKEKVTALPLLGHIGAPRPLANMCLSIPAGFQGR